MVFITLYNIRLNTHSNFRHFVCSMVEKTVPHVVNRGLGRRQKVSTYACPNDGEYIEQQCSSEEQKNHGSPAVATQ
jgi:hypothetical protein